jgi:MFS family permease
VSANIPSSPANSLIIDGNAAPSVLAAKPASLLPAWWALAVMMALYTSSFIDRSIIGLLVAPIRRDLQISDTGVSLLQGFSFALFYTVLGLPAGRLADKGSRKWLIACGAGLWSLATALCGVAHSYIQLFFARMGVGVGEATLTPSAHSLLADLFPRDQQAKAISIYQTGISMGQGFALLIGGFVIHLVSGMPEVSVPVVGQVRSWQMVFVVIGAPGLLLALLALTIREPARRMLKSDVPSIREAWAFMARNKRAFGCWIFGTAMFATVTFGFPAWMPTVLIRKFGMTASEVGAIYGAMVLLLGPIGGISAGALTDYLFRRGIHDAHWRVIVGLGVAAMPFAIAAPLVDNRDLALVCLGAEILLMNVGGVNGAAQVMAVPPRLRGQMTAIYFFVSALLGFGLWPTFVALLTDRVYRSDAAVGLSLATACIVAMPLAVILLAFARRPFVAAMQGEYRQ